jgi:GTP:adenosylcobinamide-phosphate guanylyltransferase
MVGERHDGGRGRCRADRRVAVMTSGAGSRTKVDVVILAGGDGEVIDPTCRFKGLLPVSGRPLVEWVIDAFAAAELVNDIAVVMPTAEGLGSWVDRAGKLVVSDRSFMENVLAGVAAFRDDRPVVVATGDIPLATPAALDSFIRDSLDAGADFTYPVISRADMESDFPGSVRTYFRLKSGLFTGGNLMLVNPLLLPALRDLGQRLFDQRKNPVGMLRLAGLRFVVRFLLGRLEPTDLADKIEQLLGGTGAAVVTHETTLAVDVDKRVDLELVERVLAERDGRIV